MQAFGLYSTQQKRTKVKSNFPYSSLRPKICVGNSVSIIVKQEWRWMWMLDIKFHCLQSIKWSKLIKFAKSGFLQKEKSVSWLIGIIWPLHLLTCLSWLVLESDSWYGLWIRGSCMAIHIQVTNKNTSKQNQGGIVDKKLPVIVEFGQVNHVGERRNLVSDRC